MKTMNKTILVLAVLVVFLLLPRTAIAQPVPDGAAISVNITGSDVTQINGPLSATYQTNDEHPLVEWHQFAGTIQTSEPDVWAIIVYTFNVTFEGNLNLSAIVTAYGNVNRTMMAYNWTAQSWNNLTSLPAGKWTNVSFTLPSEIFVAANGTCLVGFHCVGYWYVPCAILVDYISITEEVELIPPLSPTAELFESIKVMTQIVAKVFAIPFRILKNTVMTIMNTLIP